MITFPNSPLALLLAQAPAPGAGLGMTQLVVQFGLIIAIIYFIMIRPQQRQRRKHEELLNALKKGDEIVTAGGIVGEVIHIREMGTDGAKTKADDRVTIKSGESRLIVERGRIARINGSAASASASSKSGAVAE
jgi:preprotein translocase subunit YajC